MHATYDIINLTFLWRSDKVLQPCVGLSCFVNAYTFCHVVEIQGCASKTVNFTNIDEKNNLWVIVIATKVKLLGLKRF